MILLTIVRRSYFLLFVDSRYWFLGLIFGYSSILLFAGRRHWFLGLIFGESSILHRVRLSKGHRDDRTSLPSLFQPLPHRHSYHHHHHHHLFLHHHTLANGNRKLEDPWIRPH